MGLEGTSRPHTSRPHTWQAEGCPPYPREVQQRLEAAYAAGERSAEVDVAGKRYIVDLHPGPFKQIQKADRTRTRRVERLPPSLTRWEKMLLSISRTDPKWCCSGRLRRNGLLLLLGVTVPWVVTSVLAWSLLDVGANKMLFDAYINSIAFWGCFAQTVAASMVSKLAICMRAKLVARSVRSQNQLASALAVLLATLAALEGAGLIGRAARAAPSFQLLSHVACGNLLLAACLHANLALHAWGVATHRISNERGDGNVREKAAPLPLVSPMMYDGGANGGGKGRSSSPKGSGAGSRSAGSRSAGTATADETVAQPPARKDAAIEDNGSRVLLPPEVQPMDDRTYVMYHGTRPKYADAIEKYGFLRSKNGMLGEGVYLSRDVAKAAHYPLDVPDSDLKNRVILECLVNVGKVKRIDCAGHPMQLTWAILGCTSPRLACASTHCGQTLPCPAVH